MWQQALQFTASQACPNQPGRQTGQSQTPSRGVGDGVEVAQAHTGLRRQLFELPVRTRKFPRLCTVAESIGDRVMGAQVLQGTRGATRFKITRRRADDRLLLGKAARHQIGAATRQAHADRQIESIINEIDHMVTEMELHMEFGMIHGELGQDMSDA